MRVLVEILHPAHVHFFRNAILAWQQRGDEVLVLSREKDVTSELLLAYEIPFESISRLGSSKLSLLSEMVLRDVRMLRRALKFKPDVLVGIMGVTIAQVGLVLRRPAVVFYDTENARLTNRVVYPLAHSVCTPQCYAAPVNGRHVTYPGYHELAYLHPNRFRPDPEVVRAAGIDPDQPFFLLRFVSWQASHDVGEEGFSLAMKQNLVASLARRGRVLISSEQPLPSALDEYRFSAAPHSIHHFIAHARMLIGESATMASEAAVLGVPAFYIADTGRGYTDEQQARYGLVFNYRRSQAEEAFAKIESLLDDPRFPQRIADGHARLLADKIDATDWMLDYIDRVVGSS
jgi:predicted glycosyltransferase